MGWAVVGGDEGEGFEVGDGTALHLGLAARPEVGGGRVAEVSSEGVGHSRSPLLPPPAAVGAPLASHAVEGSDHEQQEAHADGHGHDSHSSLGGLGGHCGEETEEALSGRALHPAPGPVTTAATHQGQSGTRAGRSRGGWRPRSTRRLGSGHWSPSGSGSCSPSPGLRGLALPAVGAQVRPGPVGSRAGVRAEVMSSPPGSGRGGTVFGSVMGQGPPGTWVPERESPEGTGGALTHTASHLAPLEFGLRVTAGRADQLDFIPFCPAALGLGQSLLWP